MIAADIDRIAEAFVNARLAARALPAYPGVLPAGLDEAYACQDAAIARWPDRIAGWKVGWITDDAMAQWGERRLVGPIFAAQILDAAGATPVDARIFAGGFAAVEAEYVFQLGHDATAGTQWTPGNVAPLIDNLRLGIEVASSPLPAINDLGPAVTISDFGNNAGLIVGPPQRDWAAALERAARCEVRIDAALVGTGGVASIGGGPLAGLAFALNRNAQRGRPLRAGDLVTTGACTGVHGIAVGQSATARFGAAGEVACRIIAAAPGSPRADG